VRVLEVAREGAPQRCKVFALSAQAVQVEPAPPLVETASHPAARDGVLQ